MKKNIIFHSQSPILVLLAILTASPGVARAEILSEPFDYQPNRIEIREGVSRTQDSFHGGSGWDLDARNAWRVGFWGNLEQHGGEVSYDIFHPGSLQAEGTTADKYTSSGGRFANNEETLVISAIRQIDVEGGPLSYASLPATAGEENPGRSVAGIGAGGKEVWLSALMLPGSEKFGAWLKLNNTGYGSTVIAPGGLVFHIDGETSTLNVEQDWSVLNKLRKDRPARGSEVINVSSEEAVLLIAKIQFGTDWGGDTQFATKDVTNFDPTSAPTDGTVTVWINPDLSSEPSESEASVQVPIFEFRFSAVAVRLAPGAAIDELRLAPTFDQLLIK